MATVVTVPNAKAQTEFLAPGIRLIRLMADLKPGEEHGDWLDVVEQDILRVEVTRVNSGSSQYSITLNNWFDSIPTEPKQLSEKEATEAAKRIKNRLNINEKIDDTGRPAQPRYKYNDLKLLRFGDRLRIELGYRSGRLAIQGFVPMIAGPITDIRFSFADAGAQLTISGEDDLSALKDKQKNRVEFSEHSERRMVEEILKRTNFPLNIIAEPLVAPEKFFTDDKEGISESLQKGQSYLDFLQKLADPLDFEVFLEFNSLADPNSGQSFHFEPCRARRPAKTKEGIQTIEGIHKLVHGVNLMEFTPTIKVADQYSSVEITGKHRDRLRPEHIKELATFSFLKDELHFDPALDQPLLSGPEIRGLFFKGRLANEHSEPASNIDKPRAAWRAQSLLRKKAREFMTIEGTTIGLPKLRPGNHVEIRGMRAPFDGFYYVTKTVHTYGADGFRTRFSAHRPGMPKPQD